jgi:uncharacterized protein YndB with AHSA1/START domain/DNA-binding transcriptional ArsR family regulator
MRCDFCDGVGEVVWFGEGLFGRQAFEDGGASEEIGFAGEEGLQEISVVDLVHGAHRSIVKKAFTQSSPRLRREHREDVLTCDLTVTYYVDVARASMDAVFKALADPTRRRLLDTLFKKDGQTLGALEARCSMTRFGVMKHLRVLEKAGVVVTRKRGREKLHFLNAVPIRLLHDRWVNKYTEPWVAALSDLKTDLEKRMEKVFEIYIKTSPELLWDAITNPAKRAKYTFGLQVTSEWKKGSKYQGTGLGNLVIEGEVLEIDPPRKLVQSFNAMWSDAVKNEGTSRVTWEITPVGDSCRLVVTHDQMREGAHGEIWGGWPMILSGLKTLLETGELLTTPGSMRWKEG